MFGGELLPGEGSKQNADGSEYDGAESRRENIFKYRYVGFMNLDVFEGMTAIFEEVFGFLGFAFSSAIHSYYSMQCSPTHLS